MKQHDDTKGNWCSRRVLVGAVSSLLIFGSPAMGQSASAVVQNDRLSGLVEQLKDPSFQIREEASRRLGELVDDDLDSLYQFLKANPLNSEQRYRMLQIYGEKLINRPRGALGISSQAGQRDSLNPRVEIKELVEGMPAEKVLKRGDQIRRIDGHPIRGMEDLSRSVQTKRPGDIVLITIDRPKVSENGLRVFDENAQVEYETLQVEFELGSLDDLSRSSQSNRTNISQAVVEQRRLQVQDAIALFGPAVLELSVINKSEMYQALTEGSSRSEIDDHPIIQAMLQDISRIVDGKTSITEQDVERWNTYQRQLSSEHADPDMSRVKQAYVLDVLKRFFKLRSAMGGGSRFVPINSPSNRPRRR